MFFYKLVVVAIKAYDPVQKYFVFNRNCLETLYAYKY